MSNLQKIIEENEKAFLSDWEGGRFINQLTNWPNKTIIKKYLLSSQLRLIEGFKKVVKEKKKEILSGCCKCCGKNPCDYSTTGCHWGYSENDTIVEIINDLLSELNKIK
jgi:hypothetical protein